MLRELADEGRVERRRKKLHHPGTLPHVVVADVTARDRDGELIARPDRMGRGRARRRRRRSACASRAARGPNEVAGVGDRVLLRVEDSGDDGRSDPPHRPRHQAHRPRQAARARHFPRAAGRRRPARADRQEAARPRARDPARRRRGRAGRRPGRGRGGGSAAAAMASPSARVTERLGSLADRARGQPDRHPRPSDPARLSRRRCWRRRKRPSRRGSPAARTGATLPLVTIDPADAKDHDDAVHADARRRPEQSPAASSSASPSPTSPITCGRARRSTARRWCAATRSISPTAWCRCCRSASPTISARCGPARTAPRSRCASWSAPTAASARTRFHRVLMRSAAKLNYAAGAGRGRRLARRHHRPAARPPSSSRSMPPIARSSARATSAARSISTCRSARSCSPPTTPSIA